MTSPRRALVLLLVILTALAAPTSADDLEHIPRLRPLDPGLRELIEMGAKQSPSFRALVERINRSDVVVYIRCGRKLRPGITGQMTFMGASGGLRYVVVVLATEVSPEQKIATLGHEFRHVVEVVEAASVVDARSLGVEYARIGRRSRHEAGVAYDTDEAIDTGARVWREVMGYSESRGE